MLIDNRNYLRISQRPLLYKLDEAVEDKNIVIEPSKKGLPTLKVTINDKNQYIHSKYDPEKEAEKLIEQIKDIDKSKHVLFIGTGLGYHIKNLLKKFPGLSYSIYEPNLTTMKHFFSNFNINEFPKSNMKNVITSREPEKLTHEIASLLQNNGTNIFVYTLPSYSDLYIEETKWIFQALKDLLKGKRNNLAVNASFQKRWTINSIKNFPSVLQTPNILKDVDKAAFEGKPAIIVAAGPSLNEEFENLRYIKENGLAYIFSVGSAINSLIEHGIYPDAACTYDPQGHNYKVIDIIKKRGITGIPLIFGSSVGYETLLDFPGQMFHMSINQDTIGPFYLNDFDRENVVHDAASIAIITFQLLSKLGCSQIALVGQNLAFVNNHRYAKGIDHDYVTNEISDIEKNKALTVKDVNGHEIHTSESYHNMRIQLEKYIEAYSVDLTVFNTTKNGAHIRGTKYIPLDEIISEFWTKEKVVSSDWTLSANTYDLNFTYRQSVIMLNEKQKLDQIIIKVNKELKQIMSQLELNQINSLNDKFISFDKIFNKLSRNTFYKVYIEPMMRIHNERFLKENQALVFERDLHKKGTAMVRVYKDYLNDCKQNYIIIEPYFQEMHKKIIEINN
ncbi:motility associated factor glycosyltransferase family protein [Planomicrobium sp. MB-3u-38]|uniref:motility associated factor glycosyltransferase family protein n=1 Tax=Planomicrobium sp. MB-3u-38 TaxID=2058318 RepID=UPI000C7B882A|nr:6-hydroxymethylpterin diphosphokinase MptE-like protein [Planomicrobium sp. MB-3u-38]PKH10358.1 hypothetical protein CXF70_09225 [Planomicrobium sp. MB-3u-38]